MGSNSADGRGQASTGANELNARIAQLEAENAQLREAAEAAQGAQTADATGQAEPRTKGGRRWLSALAAAFVVLGVVLAPVAVAGTWARAQLVDTERFTTTFAPLAQEAAVQAAVTDQVMVAVEDNVDIDGLIDELFVGLNDLDMPAQASAALPLLKGPAAAGVRSIMRGGVERVVASPQFAALFEGTLRQSHTQIVAVLQSDPDSALELTDEGALALRLDVVLTEVKRVLGEQGFGFADQIPVVDRTVPLVQSDDLLTVRTAYTAAATLGYVLPWVVLALLIAGVALSRRSLRALAWTAGGLIVTLGALGIGFKIGRQVTASALSPDVMSAHAAGVVYDQVTLSVTSVVAALVMLSVFVLIGALLAGPSRVATRVRGLLDAVFGAARGALDRHGLHPRGVGQFVTRWRRPLQIAAVLIAVLIVMLVRPVSSASVITALVVVVLVLVAIELVRRDSAAPTREEPAV